MRTWSTARRSAAPRRSSMYRVRTTTVPLAPDQCPSMSAHGTLAPTTGSRDRDSAHGKRQPRNAGAKGSSKSRVVAAREDSVALQRATTVAVRLTAACILLLPPPPAPDRGRGRFPVRLHVLSVAARRQPLSAATVGTPVPRLPPRSPGHAVFPHPIPRLHFQGTRLPLRPT